MSEKRQPWMKWFPADWRGDPRLRMSTLAARGLWADLIAYMHEGEPYGHLTIDGIAPDLAGIAGLVGRPLPEVRKALAELEQRNVFSRTEGGVIYSRRMVRDKAKQDRDRTNGKGGGNPNLKPPDNPNDGDGVNPPDKAQKPEARDQKDPVAPQPPAGPAPGTDLLGQTPIDLKREIFKRGRAFLTSHGVRSDHAGSLIGKWRSEFGNPAVLDALAACEAECASDPVPFIEKTLRSRHGQATGHASRGDRVSPATAAAARFLGRQHGLVERPGGVPGGLAEARPPAGWHERGAGDVDPAAGGGAGADDAVRADQDGAGAPASPAAAAQ